jgi:hypothetical protein
MTNKAPPQSQEDGNAAKPYEIQRQKPAGRGATHHDGADHALVLLPGHEPPVARPQRVAVGPAAAAAAGAVLDVWRAARAVVGGRRDFSRLVVTPACSHLQVSTFPNPTTNPFPPPPSDDPPPPISTISVRQAYTLTMLGWCTVDRTAISTASFIASRSLLRA